MKGNVAIVVRRQNEILFIQRAALKKFLPNRWAFPSGTIEEGETVEMTSVREAKEELGLVVRVETSLGEVELPELGVCLHFAVCAMDGPSQEIVFDPGEVQAIKWLTFEEFFEEYVDEQIRHGLQYLRKHPQLWQDIY